VVLTLLYANGETVLIAMARWLNVGRDPTATDYVMVLNGDPNARPFVAAAQIQAGLTSKALLAPMNSVSGNGNVHRPSSLELAEHILISKGIPRDHIIQLAGPCETTFDEAKSLSQFLHSLSDRRSTVSVVTSNFHTRRASWVFRQTLGSDADRVRFIAAPVDGFTETNWWQVEDGFVTYLTEYFKFLFYLFRYSKLPWIVTGLTASTVVVLLMFMRSRHVSRVGAASLG